jgi:glutathione S-transferase
VAKYYSVEEARNMTGLRLVVTARVPGLWSEAVKSIFDAKHFPYVLVEQVVGGENLALKEWTAQTSAPVIIWNDERPRSTWNEQLYLAERLAPTPSLIPEDLEDRLLMFGLCNEMCSENGYGWNMRLRAVHRAFTDPNTSAYVRKISPVLAHKYGYDAAQVDAAQRQMEGLLHRLRTQLEKQQKAGRNFLIGDKLSALDIYWAVFCGAIDPLPEDLCPGMNPEARKGYFDAGMKAIAGDALMAHRDRIYRDYLKLPLDF